MKFGPFRRGEDEPPIEGVNDIGRGQKRWRAFWRVDGKQEVKFCTTASEANAFKRERDHETMVKIRDGQNEGALAGEIHCVALE